MGDNEKEKKKQMNFNIFPFKHFPLPNLGNFLYTHIEQVFLKG